MRRIPFALAALMLLAATPSSQAQWFGPEGPRGGMAGRAFEPVWFGGWGPPMWRWREARQRRLWAWRRWVESRERREAAEVQPHGRTRPRYLAPPMRVAAIPFRPPSRSHLVPERSGAAVAIMPMGQIHRPRIPAVAVPHVLHAVVPIDRSLPTGRTSTTTRPVPQPTALRSDPGPAARAAISAKPTEAAPTNPGGDVPVAPLD